MFLDSLYNYAVCNCLFCAVSTGDCQFKISMPVFAEIASQKCFAVETFFRFAYPVPLLWYSCKAQICKMHSCIYSLAYCEL